MTVTFNNPTSYQNQNFYGYTFIQFQFVYIYTNMYYTLGLEDKDTVVLTAYRNMKL